MEYVRPAHDGTAQYRQTVSSIYRAALNAEKASIALAAVANYVGASSVAYVLTNKFTEQAIISRVWGNFVGNRADYLTHYSKIDPFLAALKKTEPGRLISLSDCLPPARMRHDEWYNDYTLKGGTCDLFGSKLHESSRYVAVIGLHHAIGEAHSSATEARRLQALMGPLRDAARLHVELIDLGYSFPIGPGGLDHSSVGAIIVNGKGQIVETNRAAERILRAGDGLLVRYDRLSASRAFETAKLASLIAAAAPNAGVASAGSMLIARGRGQSPHVARVVPVDTWLPGYDLQMAMVLVSIPSEKRVSEHELAQLYGLTPAESRIALALERGKRLTELVAEFGVQLSTLRTQLSSALKKCGVERQSELVRLVTSIPVAHPAPNETDQT